MSYFNAPIKIYTNLLNHATTGATRDYNLNYDPANEPSVSGETYTSSGGEASGALYDLVDNKQDTVVTFDSNGQSTTITIDFDLTTSISPDALIVMNHNFESNAKIRILKSGSAQTIVNGFSGNIQEEGHLQLEGGSVNSTSWNSVYDKHLVATFSGSSGSAWELELTPGAANYISDITIGEVAFCNTWTAPHAPEVEGWQDTIDYNNDTISARGGQAYSQGYGGERKAWNLSWTGLTNTQKDNLQQAFRETKGSQFPFWVDLGEDVSDAYLHYVRLASKPVYTPIAGGTLWNASFSIRQEI